MPSISGPRSTVASSSAVTPFVSGAASSLIVLSSLRQGKRGRLRRWLDDFGDDPAVLADLAVADESQLLVGRQGAVEEEARRHRTRGFGVPIDPAAAETCDQI